MEERPPPQVAGWLHALNSDCEKRLAFKTCHWIWRAGEKTREVSPEDTGSTGLSPPHDDSQECWRRCLTRITKGAWRKVLQSWAGSPLLVTMVAVAAGSWAGASWGPGTTRYISAVLIDSWRPQAGEAPAGHCVCQHPRLSPLLPHRSLPLLLLADYPRRNEAFVFREPGQRQNKSKKHLDKPDMQEATLEFSAWH